MKPMFRKLSHGALAMSMIFAAVSVAPAEEPTSANALRNVLNGMNQHGATWFRQGTGWLLEREYVDHLLFMTADPRGGMGGGGFYRPSMSRLDWKWLRERLDKDGDGTITLKEFPGPREWFEALDKNQDGVLTAEDFEWFGDTALAKAQGKAKTLFTQIDLDGNGQLTLEEWNRWFEGLSRNKGYLCQDDLLPLFLEKKPSTSRGAGGAASTARNRLPVVCSYVAGDVGSLSEGPRLGEKAPDFLLSTVDGTGKLALSAHEGKRPLILVFGSFT